MVPHVFYLSLNKKVTFIFNIVLLFSKESSLDIQPITIGESVVEMMGRNIASVTRLGYEEDDEEKGTSKDQVKMIERLKRHLAGMF